MSVQGKRVVLAVTGGIAAFKSASLASQLTQAGAKVQVMMTKAAKEFIAPLTFQALTRSRVYDDTFREENPEEIAHIDVADEADVIVVAPATADAIARMAQGHADDMVTTTLLATKAPVFVSPAMNVNMYHHPAVQKNLQTLADRGVKMLEAGDGYLACGWVGKGRMAEPVEIQNALEAFFTKPLTLQGVHVLVTAGPTREMADPVRFLSNPSSGRMGFAIAEEAARRGAEVTLIAGPVELSTPPEVHRVNVVSAEEMYNAVTKHLSAEAIVVKTAAVSDYRPKTYQAQKAKKEDGETVLELERTPDILKMLGEQKEAQFLVGFAAETDEVETYAKDKLERKNLDMVVANDITADGAGFAGDTNEVMIMTKEETHRLPALTKRETSVQIWDAVEQNRCKGQG
ncbi:phosphopantothenate-cysteine ligase /phosphopantothenoylcysteine decarboxylase [Salsuginibacillus halophilus]|uniref:Coenzyme A biosynthesis bifunctional protein CoaBC n=1 Tax=Salsuginibacillus halophilus TaxID=517424 RepID=A0A2P8HY29_9BACI|nr:bifunctional phosphopantothenoylcysteine decarboxylase/phosphopantothenate--cysteine ligase CoaBC [Salsuginibacillus halophilus]PSL51138.1 phosphopantothenate-cysteine ligase /phosphopantothenoylcysteine decarboxylase [Salsuginibacillus halophilus]